MAVTPQQRIELRRQSRRLTILTVFFLLALFFTWMVELYSAEVENLELACSVTHEEQILVHGNYKTNAGPCKHISLIY